MTRLLTLVAVVSAATGLYACGGGSAAHSTSRHISKAEEEAAATTAAELRPAALEAKADADQDNDGTAAYDDTNNSLDFNRYRPSTPAERQAVTALVKRYYALALAGDGAKGCSLIFSTIAEGLVEDNSLEPDAPAYMRGSTSCAQVLDALFKHFHTQLAAELPKLRVTNVRIEADHGLAFLSFGTMPERKILLKREVHVWKLGQIYDEALG